MIIVATSAALGTDRRGNRTLGKVMRYQFELTGKANPRVCYVGTAGGECPIRAGQFLQALSDFGARPSQLTLFPYPNVDDIQAHLLEQDAIWVGGGSVVNLLALWRAHGVDKAMRAAWESGVVLGGCSAGSLCWHVGGTTDSYGPDLRLVENGLGLLPFSNTPHYDTEEQRRPLYQSLVASRQLPPGWATDDGVGLVFRGTELSEVLSESEGKAAWKVDRDGETRLDPRLL